MNPRQRQGLLLVVIAAAALVGVFVLIASYVSNVAREVGPMTHVLALTQRVAPNEAVTPNMLTEKPLPEKWVSPTALTNPSQTYGLVAAAAFPPGHYLQQGDLVAPPTLTPPRQEIAVYVNPETGVLGQVAPNDLVDIIATYQGNNQNLPNSAQVVVADAKVLNVGTPTNGGGTDAGAEGTISNQVVPVYFSLTPEQVLKVSYAESFAHQLRLSLVAPGTTGAPVVPHPYQPFP